MALLSQAASDEAVRAVILTGTGRAFCAGGDLNAISRGGIGDQGGASSLPGSYERSVTDLRTNMRSSQILREMPKLSIAAVNGACAGAGFSWACAADVRYAARSAVFNTAFMTAGLSGDFGGTWTLPRIVGSAKARELYLLPRKFDAAEALRIGLVSEVLPDDELLDFARDKARQAASYAPLTFAWVKENLNDADRVGFSEALDGEARRHVRSGMTEDAREAAASFLQKRPPQFKGR
jgi:2-(1,2-epoxy-1,2-dihydrophenyl)acetyl-CoA isomerase